MESTAIFKLLIMKRKGYYSKRFQITTGGFVQTDKKKKKNSAIRKISKLNFSKPSLFKL